MGRKKQTEQEKLAKVIGAEGMSVLDSLSRDELKSRVAAVEGEIRESEQARDADQAIKDAVDVLKNLRGPYNDAIERGRAIQRYAAIRIAELGG
jgi:uncharacterized small protein (DUF1192 family)